MPKVVWGRLAQRDPQVPLAVMAAMACLVSKDRPVHRGLPVLPAKMDAMGGTDRQDLPDPQARQALWAPLDPKDPKDRKDPKAMKGLPVFQDPLVPPVPLLP